MDAWCHYADLDPARHATSHISRLIVEFVSQLQTGPWATKGR